MIAVTKPRKLKARLAALLVADGGDFVTRPVEACDVDLDGIPGDRHRGPNRPADARVPWYPRGTPIRNERQLSAVSPDDLAALAGRLGVPGIEPAWLGANLVVEGLADLSFLPRGTRLHFPSGLALAVADQNAPCLRTGRVLQGRHPDRDHLGFAFLRKAVGLRGIVLWVERAGGVAAGDPIAVHLPAQWTYPA